VDETPEDGVRGLPRLDERLQLAAFAVVIVIVAEPFCWIDDGLALIEPDALA